MRSNYVLNLNNSRGCQNDAYDETDKLPIVKKISDIYLYGVILSIVTHVLDIILDFNLAYQYYRYNEHTYFIFTIVFTLIPSVIVSLVSARIYTLEEDVPVKRCVIRSILLLFQLSPILRCYELIDYARKCRKAEKEKNFIEQEKYYALATKEDSNIALMRIIESFLESAPQQILQIAILLNRTNDVHNGWLHTYQLLSVSVSVISMSWSIVLYNRSIRFAIKEAENIHWSASIILFMWHFLTVGSRILSTSEVASVFPRSTLLCCTLHCLLVGLCLRVWESSQFCTIQRYNFCSKLMETLFCLILGFVYLFVYVSTVEGKTRKKYSIYYVLYFAEILIASTVWYLYHITAPAFDMLGDQQWCISLYVMTVAIFPIGLLFMTIYYYYLHPTLNKQSLLFNMFHFNEQRCRTTSDREKDNNCDERLKMDSVGTQTDGSFTKEPEAIILKSTDFRNIIDGWLAI